MKKVSKNNILIPISITLSAANVDKVEKYAKRESRGNRSAWMDKHLSEFFATQQKSSPQS